MISLLFFISTTPDSIANEALLTPSRFKFSETSSSNFPDNLIVPFFNVDTIGA